MATNTFTYTGSEQTWTVPSGVNAVIIECYGAGGAPSAGQNDGTPGNGGSGGYAKGTLSVSPGETLYVYVGGAGGKNSGGWNGGGTCNLGAGGGGGASDVRQAGSTLSDRKIVAGGGGGGGEEGGGYAGRDGGDGGGEQGNKGQPRMGDLFPGSGYGGTQTSGGAAGAADGSSSSNEKENPGSWGAGGDSTKTSYARGGGGGGGGYYGGGAGSDGDNNASVGGGGGGGSSYIGDVTDATTTTGGGKGESTDGEVVITYYEQPATPNNVSATVNGDDSITVSWDKDTSGGQVDGYDIQISRDGSSWVSPSGGPSTVTDDGSSSYSATYNPSSDNSFASQVGADSSFQFRVRQTNATATGNWSSTSTVYTSPIPPHTPGASRSDGTSITVSWANQSSIESGVDIEYRQDSGSGWGSWTSLTTTAAGATSYSWSNMSTDARYQFRLRTVGPDGKTSDWVRHDYGNNGGVAFSDDFESGVSNWSTTSLGDSASGAKTSPSSEASTDTNVSGPDSGSYLLELQAGDYVRKSLGDLSGESTVHVRAAIAVGSMDNSSETVGFRWYDGSAWQNLKRLGWAYNKGGWLEIHADVPSSWLATDNRLEVTGYGGSGDFVLVDRVVVADHLDEYTTPAAPSALSLDASTADEITASWTENNSFGGTQARLYLDGTRQTSGSDPSGTTFSGLSDGEEYEVRAFATKHQYRRGSGDFWIESARDTQLATTVLPAPTLDSLSVSDDQISASWTDTSDNEDGFRLQIRRTNTETSWTTDKDLAAGTTQEWTTSLLDGEKYDVRIEVYTEHTKSQSNSLSATTVFRSVTGLSLNNSVENQVTISWDDVADYGSYRAEFRETGASTWLEALGNRTTVSQADGTTDWATGSNASLSTSTTHSEEGKSLKATTDTASTYGNRYLTYDPSTAIDLSGMDTLQFWYRTNDTGGDHYLEIRDTNGNGGTDNVSFAGQLSADTGQLVQVDLSQFSADLSSIDSIRWVFDGPTDVSKTVWLDSILAGTTTVDQATTSVVLGVLEDGEKYDIRVRSETEHGDGGYTSATTVTVLPVPADTATGSPTTDSIPVSWTDTTDNEDGFRIRLREEVDNSPQDDAGFTSWSVAKTVDPNLESTTIAGLKPNHDYELQVEVYTEHSTARGAVVSATTLIDYDSGDWTTVLIDQTGDKAAIHADNILDIDLKREHTALSDFKETIPYSAPRLEYWTTSTAQVEHYFDGQLLFSGYLERADSDERQDTTTLEGRGIGRDMLDAETSKRWQNTETWKAIRELWRDYSDFDYNVVQPTENETATDKQIQDSGSDGMASIFSPSATDPYYVDANGDLVQYPTSHLQDVGLDHTNANLSTDSAVSDAVNGDAVAIQYVDDYVEVTFTTDYTIPEADVGVAMRLQASDTPGIEVSLDGQVIEGVDSGTEGLGDSMTWETDLADGTSWGAHESSGWTGGDLDPGSHTIRVEVTDTDGSGTEILYVDLLVLFDQRFSYNFDDTLDSNNELAGPEPYPTVSAETVIESVTANITELRIASTWNDTTGDQALYVSNDGGSIYEPSGGVANTSSHTEQLEGVGTQARAKVDMNGYGTQSSTPTQKVNPQKITDWNLYYTGTDKSVIDDSRFTGDILTIAQKLHRKAGYHFTVDFSQGKFVESYPKGEVSKSLSATVKNRNPTRDLYDYANRVVVYGAKKDDGTRPKAVAEDGNEIEALGGKPNGVRAVTVVRPDIDTLDGVKSEARSEVQSRVQERKTSGELDIFPANVLPGYTYSIDWYGDGSTVSVPLKRLSVQEGFADDTATLQFTRDRGNHAEIVEAKFDQSTLQEVL